MFGRTFSISRCSGASIPQSRQAHAAWVVDGRFAGHGDVVPQFRIAKPTITYYREDTITYYSNSSQMG